MPYVKITSVQKPEKKRLSDKESSRFYKVFWKNNCLKKQKENYSVILVRGLSLGIQ